MSDLIDRQAAIDIATRYCTQYDLRELLVDIEKIQPAEPERKTGEWMEIIEVNELGEPYQSGVYCSECGHTDCYEPNYCPACGARMDEE